MTIRDTQLQAIMPRVNVALWLGPLNTAMTRFEISTAARIAAFLATVAHESNECRRLVESLNYSAKRITEVWPKRFPTIELATPYAANAEGLANVVYANRIGNGDTASGDGWRFRGRGLIQLTGRSNYAQAGTALGLPLVATPDVLTQPDGASLAAARFWQTRGCNALADAQPGDDDDADFVRITKIVNGGTLGMNERRAYWNRAKAVL